MMDLRFTQQEIILFSCLLRCESASVVWDINAFYFNTSDSTYKLECFDEYPEGSVYKYDEIFFCRFEKLTTKLKFDDTKQEYWYKTLTTDSKIYSLEIIEIAQSFPEGNLVDTSLATTIGSNLVSLGLIINTNRGVIPAFLLPSNYGFTWQDKYEFYNHAEIEALLKLNIKLFKRKTIIKFPRLT